MNWIYLVLAASVGLCGCGDERSSPRGSSSPVYSAPVATVHDVALKACMDYFGHVDRDDQDGHEIYVRDFSFWSGGATENTVYLKPRADGKTLVEIVSLAGSPSGILVANGSRGRSIINSLIIRLDAELGTGDRSAAEAHETEAPSAEARLRELDDLHAKQLVTDDEYQDKRKAILGTL